uniref:Uncharacterized protein n=1 Tax=Romanomermis culicivorax TaxID=13658 RepID=A0A915K658_ROMCU
FREATLRVSVKIYEQKKQLICVKPIKIDFKESINHYLQLNINILQQWSILRNFLCYSLENVAKKFSDKKSWAKFYYCYPFVDQRQQKKSKNNDASSEDQDDNRPSCQVQSDSGMCSDWEPDEPCFICMGKGK